MNCKFISLWFTPLNKDTKTCGNRHYQNKPIRFKLSPIFCFHLCFSVKSTGQIALLNEAEWDVKNDADRGGCHPPELGIQPRWITSSEIYIILQLIRKPNYVLDKFTLSETDVFPCRYSSKSR